MEPIRAIRVHIDELARVLEETGDGADALGPLAACVAAALDGARARRAALKLRISEMESTVEAARFALGEPVPAHTETDSATLPEQCAALERALAGLEELSAQRLASVRAFVGEITPLLAALGKEPPEWLANTESDRTEANIAALRQLAQELAAETAARAEQAEQLLQDIRRLEALLAVDETARFSPSQAPLFSQLILLQEHHDVLNRDYTARLAELRNVIKEIELLRAELGITAAPEGAAGLADEDLSRLSEYTLALEALKAEWAEQREKTIDALLAQVRELWQQCHMPDSYTARFLDSISAEKYSTGSLRILTAEATTLRARHAACAEIYKLIYARASLITRMLDFEKTASDKSRLFQSSFRLVEEERFRKTCFPNLLKLEAKLRGEISAYEKRAGEAFTFSGEERYADMLAREIAERFFNETTFSGEKTAAQSARQRRMHKVDSKLLAE